MASDTIYWNASADSARVKAESTLPERVDVAIVGGGYTGLASAIHLARAGRSVAVFDAEEIGHGCSSRNGGMVGPSFHQLGISGLTSQYGETKAHAIMQEGMNALNYFERFVAEEKLDCDLQMTGRFRGARSIAGYDATARECEKLNKAVGLPFEMVAKENQRAEIGTDFFDGGVVYHRDGGIHPRKLANALATKAVEAGAMLFPSTPVKGMRRDGTETEIFCGGKVVTARDVLVATNGYADRHRHRGDPGGPDGRALAERPHVRRIRPDLHVVPAVTGRQALHLWWPHGRAWLHSGGTRRRHPDSSSPCVPAA